MADTAAAGRWVVARLAERGVAHVFGIPGVHTIPLYAGLAGSTITHVTARHEQGAGFMADGYARVTGRPGVCFVISGPGVTNIATAMGQAYADSIPMLVLSSVSERCHLGRGLGQLHELPDQRALTAGISAFSHTLQSLAALPAILDRAFGIFEGARPRPVHIEVPLDLWREPAPGTAPAPLSAAALSQPAERHIDAAARRLTAASRPVVLAGGGARRAAAPLAEIAGRIDAPLVMTANGRGVLGPGHELAVPASPSLDAVRALLAGSDATLAVGTEIGPTDYDVYERGMPALGECLIRLDIDAGQMTRPRPADVPLTGDAAATLAALLARLPGGARGGAQRARAARDAARRDLDPRLGRAVDVLDCVRDTLPRAILVGDSTHPVYAGNLYYAAPGPGTWLNAATGYGTLGYALPASLGAVLGAAVADAGGAGGAGGAAPAPPVVCLAGDGGLQFTLGELASVREQQRPVIVLLWDNAGFGEIKLAMQAAGVAPVGVDLFNPDFRALAGAYGCAFEAPPGPAALPGALTAAAARDRPTLLRIDEQQFL